VQTPPARWWAASYGQMGLIEEAREAWREALQVIPPIRSSTAGRCCLTRTQRFRLAHRGASKSRYRAIAGSFAFGVTASRSELPMHCKRRIGSLGRSDYPRQRDRLAGLPSGGRTPDHHCHRVGADKLRQVQILAADNIEGAHERWLGPPAPNALGFDATSIRSLRRRGRPGRTVHPGQRCRRSRRSRRSAPCSPS
jgi:hypothetical protein